MSTPSSTHMISHGSPTSVTVAADGSAAAIVSPTAPVPPAAADASTMSAFLLAGLTQLYKYSGRKYDTLRQPCVEVISKIKTEEKNRQEKIFKGLSAPADSDANKYFLPLKLACDSTQPKLMAIALDTIEKLIAYGYLDGNVIVSEEVYPRKDRAGKAGTQPTAAAAAAAAAAPSPSPPASTPPPPAAAAAATTTTTGTTTSAPTSTSAASTTATATATATASSKDTARKPRTLVDVMIETLYECSMHKDVVVQRQVLKAILTCVSSVGCPVHDHGLLQAVTACYQIYLQAADETNRTTSRAALTQIFNLVFARMEHFASQLSQLEKAQQRQREVDKLQSIKNNEGIPTASPTPEKREMSNEEEERREGNSEESTTVDSSSRSNSSTAATADEDVDLASTTRLASSSLSASDTATEAEPSSSSSSSSEMTDSSSSGGVSSLDLTTATAADIDALQTAEAVEPLLSSITPGSVAGRKNSTESGNESEQSSRAATPSSSAAAAAAAAARQSPSLTPRPPPGQKGYCIVCTKPANHLCLQTHDPVCSFECKFSNLAKKDPLRRNALSVKARIQAKLTTLQNDAYYLLRALIKLSHKSLSQPPEQAAIDSKLLSLNLLLSVLQNAGPTFRTHTAFVQLVKVDLVNCLLRNSAASNVQSIFSLSSHIFLQMVAHFRPHLYKVLGPFLDSIYLPYIQSANSSFEHKHTSLLVVKTLCSNPQLVVDIFLTYDCDLGSFNTFQKMVEVVEREARKHVEYDGVIESVKSSSSSSGSRDDDDYGNLTAAEEYKLKQLALEALVGCMNSLSHWADRLVAYRQQQAQQGGNSMSGEQLETAIQHADNAQAAAANVAAAAAASAAGRDGGGASNSASGRTTALAAIGAAAAAAAMKLSSDSTEHSDTMPHPAASPSPPPPVSTGVSLASSFSTQFQFLRQQKQKLDTGIAKFNTKAKAGLQYLQQNGLLGTSAEDIAAFFHSHSGLDKIQIGDYMGDEGTFNKSVLYAYVESMDFRQMTFDDAIRSFVQGFRLPGEAQKIDRMMEKFAEQYHRQNPGRFASADTAYVLAYSIILLNTDAHNPGVKRRMTKQDFLNNCRGIDNGKDIDPAFLGEIYDRITANEIKMKDDPLVKNQQQQQQQQQKEKKKFSSFMRESQFLVKQAQQLMKTKGLSGSASATAAAAGTTGAGAAAAGAKEAAATGSGFSAPQLSSSEQKYLQELAQERLEDGIRDPSSSSSSSAAAAGNRDGDSSSSATAKDKEGKNVPAGANVSAARDAAAGAAANDIASSSSTATANGRAATATEKQEKQFYSATDADAEAIRPMFEILCFPSLATFSVLLEEAWSPPLPSAQQGSSSSSNADFPSLQLIRLCLQGYRSSIRIANALDISMVRLAFVSSLKKFTFLGSAKEMRLKNLLAIHTLLSLAATPADANQLGEGWFEILQCISEVERMHLIAQTQARGREFSQQLVAGPRITEHVPLAAAATSTSANAAVGATTFDFLTPSSTPSSTTSAAAAAAAETDSINSLGVVSSIPSQLIDRVFLCSAQLDAEGITDFIVALRRVSEQELSNLQQPRVFSLQKMVEITYYNMGRIRVVWTRIWSILSDYFQRTGCHPHFHVSMYSVDSLRQLAMRFLELEELSSFQFQRQFLTPFEFIVRHNRHVEIKELVLQCVGRMVTARGKQIKSGWTGVFAVVTAAANQAQSLAAAMNSTNTAAAAAPPTATMSTTASRSAAASQPTPLSLLRMSWEIVSSLMNQHFPRLVHSGGSDTMDACVRCLVTFAVNSLDLDIAKAAIGMLIDCAKNIDTETISDVAAAAAAHTPQNKSRAASTDIDSAPAAAAGAGAVSAPKSATATPRLGPTTPSSAAAAAAGGAGLKLWFLVLTGLSHMCVDSRPGIASIALRTLFEILSSHGSKFDSQTWRAVFHGVLLPIFDDVLHAGDEDEETGADADAAATEERGNNATDANVTTTDASVEGKQKRRRRRRRVSTDSADADAGDLWTEDTAANDDGDTVSPSPDAPATDAGRASPTHASKTKMPVALPVTAPVSAIVPAAPPLRSRAPSTVSAPTNYATMPLPSAPTAAAVLAAPPFFDSVWLHVTCLPALQALIGLYCRFHSSRVSFLLPEMVQLISACVKQEHSDELAKAGVRALVTLLNRIGAELTIGEWWLILTQLRTLVRATMPSKLLSTQLRKILLLPPLNKPSPQFYTPFIADATTQSQSQDIQSTSADNQSASTGAVNTTTSGSSVATLSPAAHARSMSAAPASAGPLPPPSLPFAAALIHSKLKVQLWLLETIFQAAMSYFPRRDMQARRREEELAMSVDNNSADALLSSSATVNGNGLSADGVAHSLTIDTSDNRLFGCMTPSQTLLCVDLLGECLNFSHAFNADISLRRKLHAAGFHIPVFAPSAAQQHSSRPMTPAPPNATASHPHPPAASSAAGVATPVPHSPAPPTAATPVPSSSSHSLPHSVSQPSFLMSPSSASPAPVGAASSAVHGHSPAKPARLPQLFYHEAHALRLIMDVLFKLVIQANSDESDGSNDSPSTVWKQELQVLLPQQPSAASEGASPSTVASASSASVLQLSELRLVQLCKQVLHEYATKTQAGQLVSLESMDEVMVGLVNNFASFPSPLFARYLPQFYLPFTSLIEFCNASTIRQAIRRLFAECVGKLLVVNGIPIQTNASSAATSTDKSSEVKSTDTPSSTHSS